MHYSLEQPMNHGFIKLTNLHDCSLQKNSKNYVKNDFCRFRFAMIHISLTHCYKVESIFNIITRLI